MKVALVPAQILRTPPATYGGLELVCYDLGVALAKKGVDVTLFAPKGSTLPGGTVVETVEAPEKTQTDWNALEEGAFKIYDQRLKEFDVVHDHSWYAWPYMSKVFQKDANIKVVHTHHGQMAWHNLPWQVFTDVKQFPFNLVGLSKSHALELSETLKVPTKFVYNGIDLDSFEPREDKEDWYLWMGRLSRFKGAHLAIEAAKKAGVMLKVAASPFTEPNQDYVNQVKGMCDGDQVELIYADLNRNEKRSILASARGLVYTSTWPFKEPFGLIPIEAAASGTPTIALINGATPETVSSQNGVLCLGVDELAESMKSGVAADAKSCREWAGNFSKEAMAENYLACYRDVIEGREW